MAASTYSPAQGAERRQRQQQMRSLSIQSDWDRSDGRSVIQCRPAFLQTGAGNAASGSAYAEFGTTKVIVSVERNSLESFSVESCGERIWAVGDALRCVQNSPLIILTSAGRFRLNPGRKNFIGRFRLKALHSSPEDNGPTSSGFGPRESKKAMMYSDIGRLNCNVTFTTFALSVRGQGSDNKEYSAMLHKALEGAVILESFPKTTVDIFALVLESGGSDLSVIISCASLALADAGIMMYDLVSSVSVSCIGKNILIDPTNEEEVCQDGSLVLACMPARNEVTQLTLTGEWSPPKINEAVELCMDACSKLAGIMRSCLKESANLSN